ncbi:MAG: BamA/TamA family outer membrane protein [Cyanobacteria bacterium P01_D01_bin.1]
MNIHTLSTLFTYKSARKQLEEQLEGLTAATLGIAAGPLFVFGMDFDHLRGQAIASPVIASSEALTGSEAVTSSDAITTNTPASQQAITIADIQLKVVDNKVFDSESLRADRILQSLSFQPGDTYDEQRVLTELAKLEPLAEEITLSIEPSADPGRIALIITAQRPNKFFYGFGRFPLPTALQGPLRRPVTFTIDNRASGFALTGYGGLANIGDSGQSIAVGITGGVNALGFETDYTIPLGDESGIAFNVANQRGVETEFDNGKTNVDLPNGDDPWVHRLGGGVEYFRPFSDQLSAAVGLSYQRVTIRDGAFSSDMFSRDELGSRLTVSDLGDDDLLTLNLAGELDARDDTREPTEGYRLLFGMDQSIPVGNASLFFNRLSANYTHFLPLNLFGFTDGPRTLVLNAQAGTILGDAPPYESFSLGGANSVRGYERGEVGTGRSFVQATAEYRFPIFSFDAMRRNVTVGGTLFADYGSDLGSGSAVIGEPAEARDKPGSGFGAGIGLRAVSDIGTARLELGVNDDTDVTVMFSVGDRF